MTVQLYHVHVMSVMFPMFASCYVGCISIKFGTFSFSVNCIVEWCSCFVDYLVHFYTYNCVLCPCLCLCYIHEVSFDEEFLGWNDIILMTNKYLQWWIQGKW
uniref:Uncharacterized protein n=1 Tax=Cacopsylla melanoneura TaxID=428564 RepID=A0A8D8ZHP2_9HEMI